MKYLNSRVVVLLWWLLVVVSAVLEVSAAASNTIISATDARLPMSLSTVISDLEAEGCSQITTACLITSHTVTRQRQQRLLEALTGSSSIEQEEEGSSSGQLLKAIGTSSGLALAQPGRDAEQGANAANEVCLTACACGGTILYYPDPVDLSREEGLFDTLAPAMEKLLAEQKQQRTATTTSNNEKQYTLIVLVDNDKDVDSTKATLERAAESCVSNLIVDSTTNGNSDNINSNRPVVLQDIFDRIDYVTPAQAAQVIQREVASTAPADAAAQVADTVSLFDTTMFWPTDLLAATPSTLSAVDLAAARKLGPAARKLLGETVERVKHACREPKDYVVPKLCPDFGELCQAVVKEAVEQLERQVQDSPGQLLWQSRVGKQIRADLVLWRRNWL